MKSANIRQKKRENGVIMQDRQLDNSTVADRLISAHDGDVALLYIYRRRRGGTDLEQAARELCRTMQEIRSAQEKLQRMGLWESEEAPSPLPAEEETPKREPYPLPADELPSYTARDIAGLAERDSSFASVCEEAVRVKGRQLSSNELGILAGIYNYLALPAEVIFMLLNYCLGRAEERQPGSRPGFRAIQQEAFHWANLEILTMEQADDYIRRQKERSSAVGRIQRLLGLSDHKLTAPERRNINAWLDMGFDEDAINLAYERTVYNTKTLKWPYMNKILQSWHAAGLHDRQAIEEKDGRRRPPRTAQAAPAGESRNVDMDHLREILENI